MTTNTDTPHAGELEESFELTVRIDQFASGRVQYQVTTDERVREALEVKRAALWLRTEPFALIGACILFRRLVDHGIVAALDEGAELCNALSLLTNAWLETQAEAAPKARGLVH